MVDALRVVGALRSPAVIDAMASVPRHAFLPPGTRRPYADTPVLLKSSRRGESLSTASQPRMVALMLEALAPKSGHAVLEIGTASGYNAALLSTLVGDTGTVVSIEIDAELSAHARGALDLAGFHSVRLVVGDGRFGYPGLAPYDRIVVTASAATVEPAWSEQLAVGGRLVVPIAGGDGWDLCTVFDKLDAGLEKRSEMRCRFVPLRGLDD